MDNLGVAMNATTIEAYALSKGIETSYKEMDNAQKIGLAMEMFLEKTAYAEGNYVKENETFAGSLNTLKASFQNFLSGVGDVDDLINSVVSFGEILIKSIEDIAPKVVDGLIRLVNGLVPQIPAILDRLLPVVIQGAIDLINGLVAALPTIIPVLMNGIVQAFSGIVTILPQILQALIDGSIIIINALADQMPVLIPQVIDAILDMIPVLIDNLPLFLEAGAKLISGIIAGLIIATPSLLQKIPEIIRKVKEFFANLPSTMQNIGINILKGLWNGIQSQWGTLKNKISSLASGIINKFKSVFGIHSPSKVFKDQIGKYMAEGLGVGFEDELDDVYRGMQNAINYEQSKLQANVETGKVFNSLQNSTPIAISLDASVEMDSQKVGRLVTPSVTRTIKNGGGV